MAEFSSRQKQPWVCCHNLEVFSSDHQSTHLILPRESQPFTLQGKAEVCLRYSHYFIPFPGTCFGLPPGEVASRIQEQYREMADVVLLCECAEKARVFYEPQAIYEYRRHGSQVSDRMGHAMEDKLQDYLLGSTRDTRVESQVRENLERRRAERFFTWAWENGTFLNFPFRKNFSWTKGLRCLRNRKLRCIRILVKDTFRRIREIPPAAG